MAQGKVLVNNLNLSQGEFPEIERKVLFIGVGSKNMGQVLSINPQSDLDDLLGVSDNEIKRNVKAALANGGENWFCYAAPQTSGYTWEDVVDQAMLTVSPEGIALCTPATDSSDLDAIQTKAEALRTILARRVWIATATEGINPATQTWADYEAAQIAIQDGVAAYRCGIVSQLHGNDLGVLMGRLCNHSVSIADSPMRVATGTVLGLGDTPVDSDGVELPDATLANLDANRISCIQRYVDIPGTYWGDFNLLDIPGGDYQVIENLRVVDKAARAVRILAVHKIANRNLNSTPISIASNKTHFSRPLREMSHSTTFAGEPFPGEILPPEDGDIEIVWPSKYETEIYLSVQPYNAPKKITANIMLDLSN